MKSKQILNVIFLIILTVSLISCSKMKMRMKNKSRKAQSTLSSGVTETTDIKHSADYTAKQIDETLFQLRKIKENALGKKIMDTLALQMKSDTPLVQISVLLKDLRTELEKQQNSLDDTRSQTEQECSHDIDQYADRFKQTLQEVQESEMNIVKLNSQLSVLKKSLSNKELQLVILEKKEEEIKVLRKRDLDDFNKRISQSNEVLLALDLVIPKLENLKKEKKELPNVLIDLSKIGKTNPIDSMVEFTSTFDKDSTDSIVGKLRKLKDSIQASISDENRYEESAKSNVELLLSEIDSTRKFLTTQKNAESNQYEEIKKNKDLQEKRKADNEMDLETNENGKKQRESTCNEFLLNYHAQTARRNDELGVISKVQGIMASRPEIMKSFISESTQTESTVSAEQK